METENKCTICLDTPLIPRLLDCLHFYCQCCIESVQTVDGIVCIQCKEITGSSTASQLPSHPLYFHSANSTAKEVLCTICEETATKFCVDCDDEYCNNCCAMHQKMKVSKDHVIRVSSRTPRLLSCEVHLAKALDFYCMDCEKLVCEICTSSTYAGIHSSHKAIPSKEATTIFDTALQSEYIPKLDNILGTIERATKELKELEHREVNHGKEIKQQIHLKTQHLISLLQNREKSLCEEVDNAVSDNRSSINKNMLMLRSCSERLETFSSICQEFRTTCKENLLLQVKPLIEKRCEMLLNTSQVPAISPCIHTITWSDKSSDNGVEENIEKIANTFGSIVIDKKLASFGKYIQAWETKFESPLSICESSDSCIAIVDSTCEAQKQKIRLKQVTVEGQMTQNIWACSRACRSSSNVVKPIVSFDGKKTTVIGIGHEVIVISADNPKTYKFGKQGNYPGQLQEISSIAFSSAGNILVSDQCLNRISMFSGTGELILCFGTSHPKGKAPGEHCLNRPHGLAIDSHDQVYVADTGNNRIAVFDHQGCYVKSIGSIGSKIGQFNEPMDVCLTDVLAVLDTGNRRVQFLNQDNNVVGMLDIGMIGMSPSRLVISSENVLVSDSQTVHRFVLSPNTFSRGA